MPLKPSSQLPSSIRKAKPSSRSVTTPLPELMVPKVPPLSFTVPPWTVSDPISPPVSFTVPPVTRMPSMRFSPWMVRSPFEMVMVPAVSSSRVMVAS